MKIFKFSSLASNRNMILHTRSYPVRVTQDKILSSTPSTFSLELTSTDFHLHSLQNTLQNMVENVLKNSGINVCEKNFFVLRPAEFYLEGIKKLPHKWQEVIQSNGNYTDNRKIVNFSWVKIFSKIWNYLWINTIYNISLMYVLET